MKSTAPTTPFGYTIFCDDVRQETGGKVSHMGVYRGKIFVNTPPPIVLPKFAFVIHYFERPEESTEPVTINVYMPGDSEDAPTVSAELPVKEGRSKAPERDSPDSDLMMGMIAHLLIAPFELKSEGRIRVRAYRGDLEIRLGTLSVVTKLDEDRTPKEAPPAVKKPKPKKAAPRKRRRSKKPS